MNVLTAMQIPHHDPAKIGRAAMQQFGAASPPNPAVAALPASAVEVYDRAEGASLRLSWRPSDMAPTILDRMAVRGAAWIVFLGRLAIAALYVPSGFNKLVHLGSFADSMAARSVPAPMLLAVVGAAVEFLGSLAILVGFRARYAALLMIAFTIVASVVSHHFWDIDDITRQMQYVQFMKNMAIIAGLLFLFAHGAGSISLDDRK
jgi:putative oxidoreductase